MPLYRPLLGARKSTSLERMDASVLGTNVQDGIERERESERGGERESERTRERESERARERESEMEAERDGAIARARARKRAEESENDRERARASKRERETESACVSTGVLYPPGIFEHLYQCLSPN